VPSNPEPPIDTLPDPPELASLRARVAALEKREAEHVRSEQVQTALYRIAEAATATSACCGSARCKLATAESFASSVTFPRVG